LNVNDRLGKKELKKAFEFFSKKGKEFKKHCYIEIKLLQRPHCLISGFRRNK